MLCAVVLTSSCANSSGNGEESKMESNPTTDWETGDVPKDEEPPAPSFEELVETLCPAAAWSCDGEAENSASVTELISGRKDSLVACELVDGYCGQGIRTHSDQKSYVDLGAGTLGRLIDGAEAVTVSMWVLPYLNANETYRLFTLQINGITSGIYAVYKNGSVQISARSSASGSLVTKTYNYNLDDGTVATLAEYTNEGRWQHLTFLIDFKNDNISLFVNGTRAYSTDTVRFGDDAFDFGTPTECDSLGGSPARRVYSFNGVMDSIMVFDRALSAEEVKTLSAERNTATSPVTDQLLIKDVLQTVGQNIVFYENSTELIINGMFEKLLADDYTAAACSKNGSVYIPKETAERLFSDVSGATEEQINNTVYLNLNELCPINGKTLLTYGSLYIVMNDQAAIDVTSDAAYLARLALLFAERNAADIPCAESRTVVAESGKSYTYGELTATLGYCSCPSIARLGDSVFVSMDTSGAKVLVFESTDGGKTFAFRSLLTSFHFATIFELNGALYLLGSYAGGGADQVGIAKSTDGAETWSPITHFKGADDLNAHSTSNSVLIANGRVYKAYNGRGGVVFENGCTAYMVSAPVDADLLDAGSWTLSNSVPFTTDLFTTHPNGSKNTSFAYMEEGNAVLGPDGTLMAIYGVKAVPTYAYAAVFRCTADGKTMSFDRNGEGSIIEFPGGNSKFTVRYDERTGKYLALVSRNTDDRYWFQRNVLSLLVSDDLVNWEVKGDVLVDPTVMNDYIAMTKHGFQYVDFIIDGDDLLLAVREAMGDSDCFHNANYLTFYRIENYSRYLTDTTV